MKDPIVIVGGGFGGVYTARALLKKGHPVLLISETNHFTFTPLLHEVATGSLVTHDVIFEYESFFHTPSFGFIRGRVEEVNREKKTVKVGDTEIRYRYLVLAVGSTTNFYDMQGTEHAFVLKNIEDAIKLKRAIVSKAQGPEKKIHVAVVGGGPTGVEVVFDVARLLQAVRKTEPEFSYELRVIHTKDTFCRMNQDEVQNYIRQNMAEAEIEPICNTYAKVIHKDRLETTNGTFPADVTVIATGVRPNTTVFKGDLELTERGHIDVNHQMQTLQDPSVFALGDIITIEGELVPDLAQTAVRQAAVVAENISRIEKGNTALRHYEPHVAGMLFSLGFGKGVGQIGNVIIRGWIAWWLWRTVYLFKTPGLTNKLRVAFSWTIGLFTGRNLTEI